MRREADEVGPDVRHACIILVRIPQVLGETPRLRHRAGEPHLGLSRLRQRVGVLGDRPDAPAVERQMRQVLRLLVGLVRRALLGHQRNERPGQPRPNRAVVVGGVFGVMLGRFVVRMEGGVGLREARYAPRVDGGRRDGPRVFGLLRGGQVEGAKGEKDVRADLVVGAAVGVEVIDPSCRPGRVRADKPAQNGLPDAPGLGAVALGIGTLAREGREFGGGAELLHPQRLHVECAVATRAPLLPRPGGGVHPRRLVVVAKQSVGVGSAEVGVGGDLRRVPECGQAGGVASVAEVRGGLDDEPRRAVHRVVTHVVERDGVGNPPIIFARCVAVLPGGEGEEDVAGLVPRAGGKQRPGQADKGVATPVVVEPRQPGENARAALVHHERVHRQPDPREGAVEPFVATGLDRRGVEQRLHPRRASLGERRAFAQHLPGERLGGLGRGGHGKRHRTISAQAQATGRKDRPVYPAGLHHGGGALGPRALARHGKPQRQRRTVGAASGVQAVFAGDEQHAGAGAHVEIRGVAAVGHERFNCLHASSRRVEHKRVEAVERLHRLREAAGVGAREPVGTHRRRSKVAGRQALPAHRPRPVVHEHEAAHRKPLPRARLRAVGLTVEARRHLVGVDERPRLAGARGLDGEAVDRHLRRSVEGGEERGHEGDAERRAKHRQERRIAVSTDRAR